MENNKVEREISLADLAIEILLHWRTAVLVMLAGGVLFAGLGYMRSAGAVRAQQAQQQAEEEPVDIAGLEEQLTEEQLNNINTVLTYQKIYEEKQTYAETAVVMKLDPFQVPRAELTFLIRTDDMERTYNIEKVYEDLLSGTGLYEYLKDSCGLGDNANETVTLERTSYGEQQGNDTVRLSIVHSEEEICQRIADSVITYVEQRRKELTETLGEHEVILLEQSYGTVMSTGYIEQQKNCMQELLNLQTNIVKLKAAFSDEEQQYYEYLTMGEAAADSEEAETVQEAAAASPSVSVKYIILGMILFAFVYVFVIFLRYILNNKIRATDNLQELYGISQLGLIPETGRKKRFLGAVDGWLLSLRDHGKRKFSEEEAVKLAAVAVKMAAKKKPLSQVYLIGCNVKDRSETVCRRMAEQLEKDGIRTKLLNNVLYDAEAMAELEQAQGVVLVEKAGSTLYHEIVLETELLARQGIAVLGGIIVE